MRYNNFQNRRKKKIKMKREDRKKERINTTKIIYLIGFIFPIELL